MLEIFQIEVGLLSNFNELLADTGTGQCAVVDPAYEVDRLLREANSRNWQIQKVLITHTHHDHIEGVKEMVAKTGAEVFVGEGEKAEILGLVPAAKVTGLVGGETIELGGERICVLATPGHTRAGISYLVGGNVMTGDTLFIGGVGRTDFPGGSPAVLWRSLQLLAALPEETRVYPGHDYGQTVTSTIGWEKSTNPYLRCASEAEFVALRTGGQAPRPIKGVR